MTNYIQEYNKGKEMALQSIQDDGTLQYFDAWAADVRQRMTPDSRHQESQTALKRNVK